MEPIPRDPGDYNARRQEMIDAIHRGIESEDYTFVVEVASSQDLLRPFEVVEFLDVKRRSSEDPVEERRWGDGLESYLIYLDGQEFPQEEADAINSVIQRFQFDRVISNEELAEEPEVQEQVTNNSDLDWENDHFQPDMDIDELESLSQTPIGMAVVKAANNALTYGDANYLKDARQAILKFQFGSSEKLRLLLDVYVCKFAEKRAKNALTYSDTRYLKDAINSLREFGSSDDAVLAMEKSLDKLVFQYAKGKLANAATYNDDSYIQEAINALDQFVSTEDRIAAMLKVLGLA